MIHPLAAGLLSGALLSNPVIGNGFISSSSEGMTREPGSAAGYARFGALLLFVFCALAWPIHFYILSPLRLEALALPVFICLNWALLWLVRRLVKSPHVTQVLPFYFLNCAVIGCGLVLVMGRSDSYTLALLTAAGMASGFWLSLVLLSHFRERIETRLFSRSARGWPVFLILCCIIGLVFQGMALLIK